MSFRLVRAVALGSALLVGGSLVLADLNQKDPALSSIEDSEATYLAAHGQYKQVIAGNKVPVGKEDITTALGKTIPDNYEINEYVSDKGPGYQIGIIDASGTHYTGYGPQAADFTYFIPAPLPPPAATTTP